MPLAIFGLTAAACLILGKLIGEDKDMTLEGFIALLMVIAAFFWAAAVTIPTTP